MRTITQDGAPRLAPLLARAALTARGRGGALLLTEVVRHDVVVDAAHLAAYDRVCGYVVRDRLPSTYLHVLTFGLQTTLMAERDFPLALPGLVHVANRLSLLQPVSLGDPLDLRVHAEGLRAHPKGAVVDLVAQARVDGELVWTGRSTYLAQGARPPSGPTVAPSPADVAPADRQTVRLEPVDTGRPAQARWSVPSDTGRRYASVSGDINPIHLSALSARAFGFPRSIAHGMWTTARCLAALEPRTPVVHDADVEFRRPVLLPSRVELRTGRRRDGWTFGVTSSRGGEHLRGRVVHG